MEMGGLYHPGGLEPTPDFSFTRDQAGLWTGYHKFHCQKTELAELIPNRGVPHHFMTFMGVSEVQIQGLEKGLVVMRINYAGFQPGENEGEGDLAEYTLTLGTAEEPVELHERYDGLSDFDIVEAGELARNPPKAADGKSVQEPDTGGWDPLKIELMDDIRRGFESYRDPKVTWSKRWVSDSRPENLNRIGEIDTPAGDPPALAAGRNWLNVGIVIRERGIVFENEETWEASGRGGWDSRYYS